MNAIQPHFARQSRRQWLAASGALGAGWLGGVSRLLARQAESPEFRTRPQSVILLWLAGGPSQLETFDPHADRPIAAGTKAIATSQPGVELAEGFQALAQQMHRVSLVRSLVSKEGDHARGTYLAKTGYNPNPALVHPAIGAVICHELADEAVEIPRHVSILPDGFPSRGGYLGAPYDAFQSGDPAQKVPDVEARVPESRRRRRLDDLEVVERQFARGRGPLVDQTQHRATLAQAVQMMSSQQLRAFDVQQEPAANLARYGATAFGRGCLAARRLIEVGVRCVEVTLAGWDSHANNHSIQRALVETLDPALASLVADLAERDLLDRTIVLCLGEFGRTPRLNPLEGRDHWTSGFSMAVAGGSLAAGRVWGATDPEGGRQVLDPVTFADVHATVLDALGIDRLKEIVAPGGRPIKLSEGTPISGLLAEV